MNLNLSSFAETSNVKIVNDRISNIISTRLADWRSAASSRESSTQELSQKEIIHSIVQDEFDICYSNTISDAKADFEDDLYHIFGLQLASKHNGQPGSQLLQIMKKHSCHYDTIKQDVHRNKSHFIESYYSK